MHVFRTYWSTHFFLSPGLPSVYTCPRRISAQVLTHVNGEHLAGVAYRDVIGKCRGRPLEMIFQLLDAKAQKPLAPLADKTAASPSVASAEAMAGNGTPSQQLKPKEQSPAHSTGPKPSSAEAELRRRKQALTEFYKRREPAKLSDVDMLLSGKYEFGEVVKSLQHKYGELPEGWDVYANPRRAELVAFYKKHDASKVPEVDRLLAHYKIVDMVDFLQKKVRLLFAFAVLVHNFSRRSLIVFRVFGLL